VHFQLEAVAVSHGGDRTITIDHAHLRGELQVGGGDGAGAVGHQTTDLQLTGAAADGDVLAVQQDVEHVFAHTGNGGVFVVHAGDAHGGDGAALEGSHQHAAQGVAEGDGLTPLKGADHKDAGLGTVVGDLVFNPIDLVLQHGLKLERRGGAPSGAGLRRRIRPGDAWSGGSRCGAEE